VSSRKRSVWVISVKSESCDDYGSHVFDGKPTDDDLEKFLRELSPDDWLDGDGPGFRGSCLHVDGPHLQEVKGRRK